MNPHIFRAYDIRGVYGKDLMAETAELIGKGFGSYLRKNASVVVGRDNRTHGEGLQQAFIRGLVSTGAQVTDIGLTPSPLLYFSNTIGEFDAGCNVTASHNPPEYNGFKLIGRKAHSICGEEIQNILGIIQKGCFQKGNGEIRKENYYDQYKKKLLELFPFTKKLKVVVDTGNGVAGKFYPDIIRAAGHEVIELFTDLDGTFPNHQPDPIIEKYLKTLKRTVIENQADIGIAFDGDGDRLGIIGEDGNMYNSDKILVLLARDVLKRHAESKIVFTVSNSQQLFSDIKNHGGKPIMCKVGHSFVENTMTEHGAILGGEQSGHFFLKEDYYPYDDAIVAAFRILKILSDSGQKFSALFDDLPRVYQSPEIRPYVDDSAKFDLLQKITGHFSNKYPAVTMDGIRIDFGDNAWAGIRVSNTSPCISICMEAESPEKLEEVKNIVTGHLKTYSEIDWKK